MPLVISRSLWRKLLVTSVAMAGFVLLYEASTFDSLAVPRANTVAPSLLTSGTRHLFTATAYCKGTTTASGVNVRTGLMEAKNRKAATMLICFNPHLKVANKNKPDILIAPDVGPEVLTGSTRLKAGTATKLILNMLTTLSMVKLGKVISNLKVDMNP
jgi:hypothetical protein